jgi:hypothetical protein
MTGVLTLVEAGHCVHQRPGIVYSLYDCSDDMQFMEIIMPDDFAPTEITSPGDRRPRRVSERIGRSVAGVIEVPQDRIDVAAPAPSGEDPVMADAGLDMMTLHVGPEAAAQFLRSQCLAGTANVVALAFDGEERSAPDRARIDTPAVPFEIAKRQRVLLKHHAHCLQVESGR